MAEQEPQVAEAAGDEDEADNPNYKPPAPKSLKDIVDQDQEDESLRKYKEQLLGSAFTGEEIILDKDNPLSVIPKKLIVCPEGRDGIEIDLTLPKEKIKETKVVLKEGCKYKVKIIYNVQREIVTGLRYEQKTYKKGIKVDKRSHMVGSYQPNNEVFEYVSPEEEAPSGMLWRGDYKIASQFIDDDKQVFMEWEWHLHIKKDFE